MPSFCRGWSSTKFCVASAVLQCVERMVAVDFFARNFLSYGQLAESRISRAFTKVWSLGNSPGALPKRSTNRSRSTFISRICCTNSAPWSVLIIGLGIAFWRGRERLALRMRPDTLWLVCWSVGGLVLMSIIPSKRVDRIYPLVPPLCLLLGAQIAASARVEEWSGKLRSWLPAALIFACIFTGGYAAWKDWKRILRAQRRTGAVLSPGPPRDGAQRLALRRDSRGREEGMLLYLRCDHFLSPDDALLRNGVLARLDALVVRNQPVRPWRALLRLALSSSSFRKRHANCRSIRSSFARQKLLQQRGR